MQRAQQPKAVRFALGLQGLQFVRNHDIPGLTGLEFGHEPLLEPMFGEGAPAPTAGCALFGGGRRGRSCCLQSETRDRAVLLATASRGCAALGWLTKGRLIERRRVELGFNAHLSGEGVHLALWRCRAEGPARARCTRDAMRAASTSTTRETALA